MARRNEEPIDGARFVANENLNMVHDLDHEKTNCMIDNFLQEGHAIPYDNLTEAHQDGMDDCPHCVESRK